MSELSGVSVEAGEPLEPVVERVAVWAAARGEELFSLDYLNSLEPTRAYCRFLQTRLESRECIIVVMSGAWEEEALLRILNILLELQSELSRPKRPIFRFVSAEPVPGVLGTLFRDGEIGEFESGAAVAVGFGVDLRPEVAPQLAAVGKFLLREAFGVEVDYQGEDGDERIAEAIERFLLPEDFPEDGVPLNTLLALGFLYGERQRVRLPWLSHWVSLQELGEWPSVILTNEIEVGSDSEKVRRIAFSPISMVIGALQSRQPELLVAAARDLRERCESEFRGAEAAGNQGAAGDAGTGDED